LSYPNLTVEANYHIEKFLKDVEIIDITTDIKAQTVLFRRKYALKLPDAIICATAYANPATLVTFDKSFKKVTDVDIFSPTF
jgi:hypothetical protein